MRLVMLCLCLVGFSALSAQTRYDVSSISEFNSAQDMASPGDSIVWQSGTYTHVRMEIEKDGLIVTAEPYGSVLFSGVSRVVIEGSGVTFSGFQYVGGFIGNLDVVKIYGNDILITHVNIQNYTCFKYLRVYEESRRTTISYCNFENRLNLDNQNILSILVDDEPGYHKIQHCSFKHFDGMGNDEGIEPIRIGVSSQGHLDSRTLVEYCYFTRCNGDGEIISHKSRQNVYRYNTFEDNPVAELVLRHGDEGIVYGNFFLNNMGGIRIREGSHHYVYNNYFEGLTRRSIYLQNDPSDPLSDVHIYHNTIVDSEEMILGGSGSNPPSNVVIANNVFSDPKDNLFAQDTESESWINNYVFGELGIDMPSEGLLELDPVLYENAEGYFQPEISSPVAASSKEGYSEVPLYEGMNYDNAIQLDLMKVSRPNAISEKAVGASEFSSTTLVKPHATEMNTGPSYSFDNLVDYVTANASQLYIVGEGETRSVQVSSNIDWTVMTSEDWISTDLSVGSNDATLNITVDSNLEESSRSGTVTLTGGAQSVSIVVFQDPGQITSVLDQINNELLLSPNPTDGGIHLTNLPTHYQSLSISVVQLDGKKIFSKECILINDALHVNLDDLLPGAYLLKLDFINQSGVNNMQITRKFFRS